MASNTHQALLLWITRKMAADGYVVAGCDGFIQQGGICNALPQPPDISGVRPDALGFQPTTCEFAFGEAKSYQDIDTPHTRKQLRVFGKLRQRGGASVCRLYIAVPRSAVHLLDRVLSDVGLLGARNIVRLHIPDCLVTERAAA